jgi:hypothetical protein
MLDSIKLPTIRALPQKIFPNMEFFFADISHRTLMRFSGSPTQLHKEACSWRVRSKGFIEAQPNDNRSRERWQIIAK